MHWDRANKKWKAQYRDAGRQGRHIGLFDDEEDAARAYNAAIRRAGLEDKRRMNAVDATGALVPASTRKLPWRRRRVGPARDPTTTTSKFWGVSWNKSARRWMARRDANGKCHTSTPRRRPAHAVNAAIRRAGLEGKRHTNPVVDGRWCRARKTPARAAARPPRAPAS